MSKVWVLDTETKGTGAEMVPIDKVESERPGRGVIVTRERPERPAKEPEPRGPSRFKVVDVMTRQVLAEDAGVRETVELLRGVRSVVDVGIHVWDSRTGAWRPLSMGERKTLWKLRDSG
jgi:hypothetical protein